MEAPYVYAAIDALAARATAWAERRQRLLLESGGVPSPAAGGHPPPLTPEEAGAAAAAAVKQVRRGLGLSEEVAQLEV